MSNSLEQPNIVFKKHTGKETKIRVIKETLINGGEFGDIFDTIIEIGGHKKRFIVKKYIDTDAEDNARKAFKNYSKAKEVGLKVFPTFRISDDGKSILMTTGFLNNRICIGNHSTNLKNPTIEEIEDLDKFLLSFFTEALKAAEKEISIGIDVPFIIVSKDKPVKIDFVLGDLDSLGKEEGLYRGVWLQNIENVRSELIGFCYYNISPNFRDNFLNKVEYFYQKSINSIPNNSKS